MGKAARIRRELAEKRARGSTRNLGPDAGANRGGAPPWMPAPGATVADANEEIAKIGQFLNAQPQLMVCGHLGLEPLTDEKRRDMIASANLYDALQTVACLQGQWDVAYTTIQRVDVVEGDFLEGGGTVQPRVRNQSSGQSRSATGRRGPRRVSWYSANGS